MWYLCSPFCQLILLCGLCEVVDMGYMKFGQEGVDRIPVHKVRTLDP